ncbi:MAG: ankyrin repeat domain-containing protein [Burkholderiales bacterium]|nr:ankyrin repeat domain-containing protein [Burkholderiales bacterium]
MKPDDGDFTDPASRAPWARGPSAAAPGSEQGPAQGVPDARRPRRFSPRWYMLGMFAFLVAVLASFHLLERAFLEKARPREVVISPPAKPPAKPPARPAETQGASKPAAPVDNTPQGGTVAARVACAVASSLNAAISGRCTERALALLPAQLERLESRDAAGHTPLIAAVLTDQHAIVEALLKVAANPNATVDLGRGQRAHGSLQAQKPELAHGSTPLMVAHDERMVALLLRFGADKDAKNEYGWFPLLYFTHHGSPEMVDVLLAAGADVNATADVDRSHLGTTSLMWAAYMNRPEHLKVLIRHRARVDVRDRAGKTALDYARGFGHQEPMRLLAAAGAR